MIHLKRSTLALALGLAAAVAATPALAKKKAQHPGFEANAQAISGELASRANDRMQALRDCNDQAAVFRDYTWGVTQSDRYRSCMAERGQPE